MRDGVLASSDPSRFVGWLLEYAELGFDGLHLHHVGAENRAFIETFGERVLPAFAWS